MVLVHICPSLLIICGRNTLHSGTNHMSNVLCNLTIKIGGSKILPLDFRQFLSVSVQCYYISQLPIYLAVYKVWGSFIYIYKKVYLIWAFDCTISNTKQAGTFQYVSLCSFRRSNSQLYQSILTGKFYGSWQICIWTLATTFGCCYCTWIISLMLWNV